MYIFIIISTLLVGVCHPIFECGFDR